MKVYSYLYKSIFIAFYNTWRSDIPHWNAAILYPLMIILNVGVLLSMLGALQYLNNIIDIRIAGLTSYGILIIINYFLYINNKHYKEIANEFDSQDSLLRKKQYRAGIMTSILGYTIPIITIVLLLK